MSDTITWIRPSGTEITTNGSPETIKFAAEHGWKPKGDEAPAEKPAAPKTTKAPKKDA